jgi:steroid delta-isomerase-like uncharacterized protein
MAGMSVQREAFDGAIAAWNAGDLDRYVELYDDGIRLHGYSAEPMTKGEVRRFYRDLWKSLSDIDLQIHEVVEDDNTLACRFTMRGTHTGELAGVPATGKVIEQGGMTILRFDGSQVVERWSVADMLSVLVQLGAVVMD